MMRFVCGASLFALCWILFGCGGYTPIHTPFDKGVYHDSIGEFDQAIAEYQEAVEEDEGDWRAWFNLGAALEAKAGKIQHEGSQGSPRAERLVAEAEAAYKKVLELRKDNIRAQVNLAALRYERGEREEAKRELVRAAATYPRQAAPCTALGARFLQENQPKEALHWLAEACQRNPGNVAAWYLRGRTQARLGKQEEALVSYHEALKRSPDDVATLVALARLELEAKHPGAARTAVQSALYVDPDQGEAHDILARILEAGGDLEGALSHYWRARDLSFDAQSRERIAKHIRALYRKLQSDKEKQP